MLLIHWTKHNQLEAILKNGITPKTRKTSNSDNDIKGIWCYPFTRNKTLNNNWKRNLKIWRQDITNFNGVIFKLSKADFPIWAGEFAAVGAFSPQCKFDDYDKFISVHGRHFDPQIIDSDNYDPYDSDSDILDYQDFEIVISKPVSPKRIKKIIKDRPSKNIG